jgi:hypothetical protein
VRLALRNKHIEERRLSKYGRPRTVTPWLYTYGFDLREAGRLKIKEFATADREWVELLAEPDSYLCLESPAYILDMLDAERSGDWDRWLEV